MKFRIKSVVIEAEQWFPDKSVDGVIPMMDASPAYWTCGPNPSGLETRGKCGAIQFGYMSCCPFGFIQTLEGGHVVSPGDWIITGVAGEKHPCKPDIFAQTYEPIINLFGVDTASPDGASIAVVFSDGKRTVELVRFTIPKGE